MITPRIWTPGIMLTSISLILLLFTATALAQNDALTGGDTAPSASPLVTATASTTHVRFVSLGEVSRLRLEVYSPDGTRLYDSKWKSGNLLDWRLRDEQEQRLSDGSYLFVVSVKDFAERVSQKYGTAAVQSEQVYLQQTGREQLPPEQAAILEASRGGEELRPVDRIGVEVAGTSAAETTAAKETGSSGDGPTQSPTKTPDAAAATQVTGTGTAGRITKWLTSTQLGNSIITEKSGNIGIGTANPTSKVEVAAQDGLAITGFQPFLTLRDTNAGGARGIIASGNGHISFYPNSFIGGNPPVTIFSGTGNVAIGKTTTDTLGGTRLDVRTDAGGPFTAVSGTSTSPNGVGVFGTATANNGIAVYGIHNFGGMGVFGRSVNGYGVFGQSGSNYGVFGDSISNKGVYGKSSSNFGVLGESNTDAGVYGYSNSGTGVIGESTSGNAGSFFGRVQVFGQLTKSSGSFKIDHPLDPANKYLSHSFVESPDMMNIYNGTVTTNAKGRAVVTLPAYFAALNRDYRYQLTVVGQFAQAIVSSEVMNNRFTIKTNKPQVKVSWQVTGVRQDAYAEKHRIPVEEDKTGDERGTYLHPEAFGQPAEKGVAHARQPASTLPSTAEKGKETTAVKQAATDQQ